MWRNNIGSVFNLCNMPVRELCTTCARWSLRDLEGKTLILIYVINKNKIDLTYELRIKTIDITIHLIKIEK